MDRWTTKFLPPLRKWIQGRILWRMLLLLISVAAVRITIDLGLRVWFELRGPEQWDASLYWAIGRGILNGLTPYQDLYESKPPGIYLITALSLWLTDGRVLGYFLQAAVLVGIAVVPTLYVGMHLLRWKITVFTLVLLESTYVFFGFLALFTATRSGGCQTESFGAFFGLLYVIAVIHKTHHARLQIFAAALLLLCTIGIKEPFLLTTAGAALLLASTPGTFGRLFILPGAIAVAFLSGLMALTGWLRPYISIYLYEIFAVRTHGAGHPLLHALNLKNIHYIATDFYLRFNAPFFWVLFLLLCYALFRKVSGEVPRKQRLFQLIAFALACYLTISAVFLGGAFIYFHHSVVMIPFLAAIFLFYIQQILSQLPIEKHLLMPFIIVLCLFVGTLRAPYSQNLDFDLRGTHAWANANGIPAAEKLDDLLNSCSIEQYQFIGKHGPMVYGYTKHSPLGPLFYQFGNFFDELHPHFYSVFLQQLAEADIVVIHPSAELGQIGGQVEDYFSQHFTQAPWPCAAAHSPIPGHTILFRTHAQ